MTLTNEEILILRAWLMYQHIPYDNLPLRAIIKSIVNYPIHNEELVIDNERKE